MTIRKNSKLVKAILSNDNLRVDVITDEWKDSCMAALKSDFTQFPWMVSVYQSKPEEINFHFHSNLCYVVTL